MKNAKKAGSPKKVIDGWEKEVKKAQNRVNAVYNEINELENKVIDGKIKDFWKLVKKNVEEKIKARRREERQIQKEKKDAAQKGNAKKVQEIQVELDEKQVDIEMWEESLKSTNTAIDAIK